jgi:hypothetical protein
MKHKFVIATGLCVLGLAVASPAWADKASGPKAKFFAKYDLNHNGVIDEDEKAAIRKDYAANPEGDLKRFDKNKDGKLDDEEIAAIKPPTGKKKGEKADTSASTNKVDKVEKSEKGADAVK